MTQRAAGFTLAERGTTADRVADRPLPYVDLEPVVYSTQEAQALAQIARNIALCGMRKVFDDLDSELDAMREQLRGCR